MNIIMIEVLSAGLFSTVQDQGRVGFRNIGVPVSGVMDAYSANLANALLDNHKDCAVIESTIIGPTLKFYQDTFIVLTGGYGEPKLNDETISINTVVEIFKGDVLSIGKITQGSWNYLAVAGGIKSPKILNSRSFYRGITDTGELEKHNSLQLSEQCKKIINRASVKNNNNHLKSHFIHVDKGPEFDNLNEAGKNSVLKHRFKISHQSNRMAYKLEHNCEINVKEIITSSVQPGTVQLTPSGELIILMRDCQTTGGYARILQLTDKAINQLSQRKSGEIILFKLV